jgi:putative transposase
VRFRFVAAERAQFPVSLLCTAVGVTRQGFYAWLRREPSARSVADQALLARIRQIHQETNCAYGAPRILLDLRHDHLLAVGKKRVARLMRQAGLRGADGSRGGPRTTIREPAQPSAPDLVDRQFARSAPNRLWVCDLKYVQTGQGFLFLAAVQDVYSRRIVGWSMRPDLEAVDALEMAMPAGTRRAASRISAAREGVDKPVASREVRPSHTEGADGSPSRAQPHSRAVQSRLRRSAACATCPWVG